MITESVLNPKILPICAQCFWKQLLLSMLSVKILYSVPSSMLQKLSTEFIMVRCLHCLLSTIKEHARLECYQYTYIILYVSVSKARCKRISKLLRPRIRKGLSSVLSSVYIHNLLLLIKTGFSHYIGPHFATALACADDIVLLALGLRVCYNLIARNMHTGFVFPSTLQKAKSKAVPNYQCHG